MIEERPTYNTSSTAAPTLDATGPRFQEADTMRRQYRDDLVHIRRVLLSLNATVERKLEELNTGCARQPKD